MADRRRARCRLCGRHRNDVGLLSWTGLCGDCAKVVLLENIDGIHDKEGVPWQRWRFGTARALLGDEVANVLYHAGVFDVPALPDDG